MSPPPGGFKGTGQSSPWSWHPSQRRLTEKFTQTQQPQWSTVKNRKPRERLPCRAARENTNNFYCMSQILLGTCLHEKLFIFGRKFQFNRASWIFISCIWQLCSKPSWKADLRKRKTTDPCMCSVVSVSHSSGHCFLSGFLPDAHEAQGRYLHPYQSCQRKPGPGHGETAHSKAQPTYRFDTWGPNTTRASVYPEGFCFSWSSEYLFFFLC